MWRGFILVMVIICGLSGFLMGVETSERAGISRGDFFTKLYYTLGLFVLGGLDIGMPTGGTVLGRGLLWFAYFAAPAVTVLSVIEGALRAISPQRLHLRRLRGHTIIAGNGGLSSLYLTRLRQRDPDAPVIVVEIQRDHPATSTLRHHAHLISGDIRSDAVLETLRLQYARRVLLLTDDDFANLDAAAKILSRVPKLAKHTVAHVANLHFMRVLGDTRVAQRCSIFNSHHIAATQLVRTELVAHFQHTASRDVLFIAGFGRFGQSLLDHLQRKAANKFGRVIIIDVDAGKRTAVFEQQVGFASFYDCQIIEGDMRDPRIWKHVDEFDEQQPVLILGSGDDGTNLRTALWAKSAFPKAYVVARTFGHSSFAEEVSREGGFSSFSVADLLACSMPEEWFTG